MSRHAGPAEGWPSHVPVGQGLVAALMSVMEPSEAEDFLSDYLSRAGPTYGADRHAFSSRVRAMADWLREEERALQSRTLQ
jgi:hypothetical protein